MHIGNEVCGAPKSCVVTHNPTLRENIEQRIAMHKSEIERLEKAKEKLSSILDVGSQDLRDAINW